jgi:hypothetical protein
MIAILLIQVCHLIFLCNHFIVNFDREYNALILSVYEAGNNIDNRFAQWSQKSKALSFTEIYAELPKMQRVDLATPFRERPTFSLDCIPLASALNSTIGQLGFSSNEYSAEDIVRGFLERSPYLDTSMFSVDLGNNVCLSMIVDSGQYKDIVAGEGSIRLASYNGTNLVLPYPTGNSLEKPRIDTNSQEVRNYTLRVRLTRPFEYRFAQLPLHTPEQLEIATAAQSHFLECLKPYLSDSSPQ